MECRICYEEGGVFVSPCKCKGDTNVHEACLRKWIETSKRDSCEICNTEYKVKEVFSWECKKYCRGWIQFNCTKKDTFVFFSTFCMSIMVLISTDIKDIFITSSIVSSAMYVLFLMTSLKNMKLLDLDTLCWWKLSYSFPLYIILLVDIMESVDTCYIDCIEHKYECNSLCPYYQQLNNTHYLSTKNFLFDVVNLVFVFLLRSFVICPKYHKKIVFDGYEHEPLLDPIDENNSNC